MDLIDCPKCGRSDVPRHQSDKHLCVDCVKAENNRLSYARQHQTNWIELAKEANIDVWLKQPGETQWEYTVWCAYRDSYPGKKPSYAAAAALLGTSTGAVAKIAQRWSFPVRLVAWIQECDRITMAQRRTEVLGMNKAYIDMAAKLRDKLNTAIDAVNPLTLRPKDISTLLKTTNEIERKAHLDSAAAEMELSRLSAGADNPELATAREPSTDDMAEVVKILADAGLLGDITHIGVRRAETTEVVLQRGDAGPSDEATDEAIDV